jgi:hypothetical protein
MPRAHNVVVPLAGHAPDATVQAEAIGSTRLSLRINGLLAFVHNQRVIRELRRAIEDAQRLAHVQGLPARTPTTSSSDWDALSVVHFGPTISTQVFFNARIKKRPHVRIETPPVTWLILDQIALTQFADLWTIATALSTHLPGALTVHGPQEINSFRNWAWKRGISLRTFESEAILHLTNGENVPWLRLLPGTRANELRHLARMYTLDRTLKRDPEPKERSHQ